MLRNQRQHVKETAFRARTFFGRGLGGFERERVFFCRVLFRVFGVVRGSASKTRTEESAQKHKTKTRITLNARNRNASDPP